MWFYGQDVFTEEHVGDYVGFVYLITELSSAKLYIGKKIFFNKRAKKPLKGKKNRRITKVSSDWQDYYGSSDDLKKAVELNGKDNYKREILRLCRTKSEMSYFESKEIFLRDALIRPEYYNNWISTRIQRSTLKELYNESQGKLVSRN